MGVFLKEKSDVFFKFLEFKGTVEEVLNLKIKKPRTNNGGEFTSHEFFSFCRKTSIKSEISCAEHPNKTTSVREIQHLVETCKGWLYAKNLPKTLWAEGITCATYVINRHHLVLSILSLLMS